MTKPLSYRGIVYSITKGPNTRDRWSNRPHWHAVIAFVDKETEEVRNRKTKAELVEVIEREINIHLDYDGDSDLYRAVENLVHEVTRPQFGKLPTAPQLRSRIGRICEIAQHIVETRYAQSDQGRLASKLRAMTVANGCTPGEAAAALEKLRQLETEVS